MSNENDKASSEVSTQGTQAPASRAATSPQHPAAAAHASSSSARTAAPAPLAQAGREPPRAAKVAPAKAAPSVRPSRAPSSAKTVSEDLNNKRDAQCKFRHQPNCACTGIERGPIKPMAKKR